MSKQKHHIERNSVQETLMIPLYVRKRCTDVFPDLYSDPEAVRLVEELDYDFLVMERKLGSGIAQFGLLEVAQRLYNLQWEIRDYLKAHPKAAVVNLGCGLDTSFAMTDNGFCRGYNFDMPDVIETRNVLLPPRDREQNVACDLNDFTWFDHVDASKGAVFIAAGVFYYFKKEEIKTLLCAMAKRFPGAVIAFDACNAMGVKGMMKTIVKDTAGIRDVSANFSLKDASKELPSWSRDFASVTRKSYMRGYRDINPQISVLFRLLNWVCDHVVNMDIVRIAFRERTA